MVKTISKPYRITHEQIKPILCYYCFEYFTYESKDIKVYNDFPYHSICLKDALQDKQRYNLIQELLDYYNMHDIEEGLITDVLCEIHEPIKNYIVQALEDRIFVYVLTDHLFYKFSRSYDYRPRAHEDLIVMHIDDFELIEKLFK